MSRAPREQPKQDDRAMRLLADGFPPSLLLDLATRGGPDSSAICESEGGPQDPWWSC